jgi:uncharacterized protein
LPLDISAALRLPGTEVPFDHRVDLPEQDILGETVSFPEPAIVRGTFLLSGDALIFKARLKVLARGSCARCLKPVNYEVNLPFEEAFAREDQVAGESDPWEERLTFSGNRVDLTQIVRSLAVLDLPLRFLCGKGCTGISETPAGRTDEPYNEEMSADAHPFAALQQLLTKHQEE